jgi:hypothetical protein
MCSPNPEPPGTLKLLLSFRYIAEDRFPARQRML